MVVFKFWKNGDFRMEGLRGLRSIFLRLHLRSGLYVRKNRKADNIKKAGILCIKQAGWT